MPPKPLVVQPLLYIGCFVKVAYHHSCDAYKTATCRPHIGHSRRTKPKFCLREKDNERTQCFWETTELSALLDDVWMRDSASYPLVLQAAQQYSVTSDDIASIAVAAQNLLCTHSDYRKSFIDKFRQCLPQGYDVQLCRTPSGLLYIQISLRGNIVTYRAAFGLVGPAKNEAGSSKADGRIEQLLTDALAHSQYEAAVTTLRGGDAQRTLDLMQDCLEGSNRSSLISEEKGRHTICKLLIELSRTSGLFPQSFFLPGVSCRFDERAGCGRNSDLYIGTYQGRKVAVKRYRIEPPSTKDEREKLEKAFWHEALLWRQLKHPSIVPVEGIYRDTFNAALNFGCTVMSWMKNGNILEYMNQSEAKPSVKSLDEWLLQVAQGLQYLHNTQIVHGDLRAVNVLIDDQGNAQLTDYGIMSNPQLGSVSYMDADPCYNMSPELLNPAESSEEPGRPTFASDTYAFAFLCVEIYSCTKPVASFTPVVRRKMVLEGERPARPVTPAGIEMGVELWSLVNECWSQSPQSRPSSAKLTNLLGPLVLMDS